MRQNLKPSSLIRQGITHFRAAFSHFKDAVDRQVPLESKTAKLLLVMVIAAQCTQKTLDFARSVYEIRTAHEPRQALLNDWPPFFAPDSLFFDAPRSSSDSTRLDSALKARERALRDWEDKRYLREQRKKFKANIRSI